jgi:hypothetical protein
MPTAGRAPLCLTAYWKVAYTVLQPGKGSATRGPAPTLACVHTGRAGSARTLKGPACSRGKTGRPHK